MGITITPRDSLPWSAIAHEFVGSDHGGVPFTFLLVEAPAGSGARLHKHPYVDVDAGQIVVIPAGQPHGFVNSGEDVLRQVDIHGAPEFSTEWLA